MKLTALVTKLAGMKKVVAGAAVAGAALLMAAPSAQAQRVRFGITVGAPVVVAPAPEVVFTGPGYYDGIYFRDYNAWHAHYGWMREQRFDRDHFYGRRFDYGHGFDRHYDHFRR